MKCVMPLNDMMSDKDMLKSEALSMSISVSRSDPNIDNKNCITKANDAIKAMHKIMSLPIPFCYYFVNNISHIFDGFHIIINNNNIEFLFYDHIKLNSLNRIYSKFFKHHIYFINRSE